MGNTSAAAKRESEDVNLARRSKSATSICFVDIMGGPCRCPRWAEAVHRRILYGDIAARSGAAFKKCAKIVGDVMGSFHRMAIRRSMTLWCASPRIFLALSAQSKMARAFWQYRRRWCAAIATRSADDRVSPALLEGIDEDAVDSARIIRATARALSCPPIANLLANGGGQCGWHGNLHPPHNLAELCDASLYLMRA